MMIDIVLARRFLSACSLLLLASCSSEPSANEISNAVNKAIQVEQQSVKQIASSMSGMNAMPDMSIKVSDLKKVSCAEQGHDVYLCDVRYTISMGLLGGVPKEMATALRMVRSDGEWLVATR